MAGEHKGVLLVIFVCFRSSEGKQILSFVHIPMAVAFEWVLTCCCLGRCYSAVTVVLSIMLWLLQKSFVKQCRCNCSWALPKVQMILKVHWISWSKKISNLPKVFICLNCSSSFLCLSKILQVEGQNERLWDFPFEYHCSIHMR